MNVTIKDIHGIGVSNLSVNYIVESNQFGDLTLSKYEGMTDPNGNDSVEVMSGNGTIKIVSGQLSPIELAVANTS